MPEATTLVEARYDLSGLPLSHGSVHTPLSKVSNMLTASTEAVAASNVVSIDQKKHFIPSKQ
jgi:purine nucleoside permease